MTKAQRITLNADWWPAACRAQGWKTSDREFRILVCSWCVSLDNPTLIQLLDAIRSEGEPRRCLNSTSELNNTDDIDRVKSCLGMLASNLDSTKEVGHPEIGRARRIRDTIRDQLKCLALYHPNPQGFVAEIIKDKFRRGSRHEPLTLDDLTDAPIVFTRDGVTREIPSQLDQVMMRLADALNGQPNKRHPNRKPGFRIQAEHTLHDMKTLAGVYCDCVDCCKRRAMNARPAVPAMVQAPALAAVGDEEVQPF